MVLGARAVFHHAPVQLQPERMADVHVPILRVPLYFIQPTLRAFQLLAVRAEYGIRLGQRDLVSNLITIPRANGQFLAGITLGGVDEKPGQ